MANINLPFGINLLNPELVDSRQKNNLKLPYTNTAEVLTQNIPAIRTVGQMYVVQDGVGGNDLWWFKDGVADGDLVMFFDSSEYIKTVGDQTLTGVLTLDGIIVNVPPFGITGGTVGLKVQGGALEVSLQESVTYTLPQLSTLLFDNPIELKNVSGGDVTVNTFAGDTIEVSDTSVVLADRERVRIYLDTETNFNR